MSSRKASWRATSRALARSEMERRAAKEASKTPEQREWEAKAGERRKAWWKANWKKIAIGLAIWEIMGLIILLSMFRSMHYSVNPEAGVGFDLGAGQVEARED